MSDVAKLAAGLSEQLACRGCGSTMTRAELNAGNWINCCPERAMNEVIEQRHNIPALTLGGVDPTVREPAENPHDQ